MRCSHLMRAQRALRAGLTGFDSRTPFGQRRGSAERVWPVPVHRDGQHRQGQNLLSPSCRTCRSRRSRTGRPEPDAATSRSKRRRRRQNVRADDTRHPVLLATANHRRHHLVGADGHAGEIRHHAEVAHHLVQRSTDTARHSVFHQLGDRSRAGHADADRQRDALLLEALRPLAVDVRVEAELRRDARPSRRYARPTPACTSARRSVPGPKRTCDLPDDPRPTRT